MMRLSIPAVFFALGAPLLAQASVCVDRDDVMVDGNEFKNCEWASQKPTRRCPKNYEGLLVGDYCAASCEAELELDCNYCCDLNYNFCLSDGFDLDVCDSNAISCAVDCGGTFPPTPTSGTPVPTGVPTTSPTGVPTTSPTGVPTTSPTGVPTTSPTGVPTASPTTSAPTYAPTSPINECEDGDFEDVEGYQCNWYDEFDGPGCPAWWWFPGANGNPVSAECCSCDVDSCESYPGWVDDEDFGCDWYENNEPAGCPIWSFFPGANGLTAGEACCHCQCQNKPGWTDAAGYTCEWYETYESAGCPTWRDYPGGDSYGLTPAEACCHCSDHFN